jgi:hypothetical protein
MVNVENFNEHRLAKHLREARKAIGRPQHNRDELFDNITDGGDRRKGERRRAFASYIENDRRRKPDRRGPCEDMR